MIPGILAVPTLDEDGDKIQFAKKILFKVLRSLPLTDDAAPWPSRESASAVINSQFAPILPYGEWPILLRVMGKTSVDGRYLSLTELRTLFVERCLPPRIIQRLRPSSATQSATT